MRRPDVNFEDGNFADVDLDRRPVFGQAGAQFYAPVIGDPVVTRRCSPARPHGLSHEDCRSRHEDDRRGAQVCNEWTGNFAAQCGDWAELGNIRLTAAASGATGPAAPGRDRADKGRHVDGVGGDVDRPRLRLEERRRRAGRARGRWKRGSTTTSPAIRTGSSRASTSIPPTGTTLGSRTAATT